ncbi:hypothetical protein L6E12_26965 [Actinokineospora sp. PR83]|uniref:hypothetical protein n=1 Tax=Actinokineospora sp. PR83 TaxID=2884908 RepID=UPI001F1E1FD1|nr:hypothetical protein [Actinokineospora sp. PR83]MCG8919422.1 hypothetical protein [Actinokineospora sp. PR83]
MKLPLQDRKLLLKLLDLVVAAHGSLTGLAAAAHRCPDPGPRPAWAVGKPGDNARASACRKLLSRLIGRGAQACPPWDTVHWVLRVSVTEQDRPATALEIADLWAAATGEQPPAATGTTTVAAATGPEHGPFPDTAPVDGSPASTMATLEQRMVAMHEQAAETAKTIAALQVQVASLTSHNTNLEYRVAELGHHNTVLAEENTGLKAKDKALSARNTKLEDLLTALEGQVAGMRQAHAEPAAGQEKVLRGRIEEQAACIARQGKQLLAMRKERDRHAASIAWLTSAHRDEYGKFTAAHNNELTALRRRYDDLVRDLDTQLQTARHHTAVLTGMGYMQHNHREHERIRAEDVFPAGALLLNTDLKKMLNPPFTRPEATHTDALLFAKVEERAEEMLRTWLRVYLRAMLHQTPRKSVNDLLGSDEAAKEVTQFINTGWDMSTATIAAVEKAMPNSEMYVQPLMRALKTKGAVLVRLSEPAKPQRVPEDEEPQPVREDDEPQRVPENGEPEPVPEERALAQRPHRRRSGTRPGQLTVQQLMNRQRAQ